MEYLNTECSHTKVLKRKIAYLHIQITRNNRIILSLRHVLSTT